MSGTWTKPSFEEIDVNGECTAYAGGQRAETLTSARGSGRVVDAGPGGLAACVDPVRSTTRDASR